MKLQTMKSNAWAFALALTLTSGLTSCGKRGGMNFGNNEFPVATLTTNSTDMVQTYPATIRGKQDIEIRPKVQGFITRLCVDEGAVVRQGQPLFLINDVEFRAAVNQAQAALNTAEAALATAELTYNNKQELFNQQIIGDYDLQAAQNGLAQAKAAKAQAEAALAAARQNLSYCTVTSPSNGVVGMIPYRVGSLVSSSSAQPLTTVSNIEEMYVYFSVTEKDLLTLTRDGDPKNLAASFPAVALQLADGSTYGETGTVQTVSGVVDQATGSVSVRADFANPQHLLKSGSSGSIVITQKNENAIILPQSATAEVQDKIFVYVVGKDNKVKYTEVEVSPQNDGINYVVTKGLSEGDVYVTNGITKLTDGMEIKPVTPEQYQKSIEEAEKLGSIQGDYKKMKEAFK